jgi:hypothetical protein
MQLVEDFTAYLADFGQAATLDGVAVRVIFDNAYTEMFDGVATRRPTAGLPTASAAAATQASVFVTGGNTYRVTSVQPDGTGWTTLTLELQ